MTARRMNNRDGIVVDAANTDGQAAVEAVEGGRAALVVLTARGTFPAIVEVDAEAARHLAAELLRIADLADA